MRCTGDEALPLDLRLLGYTCAAMSPDRLELIQAREPAVVNSLPGWSGTILASLTDSHTVSTVTPKNVEDGPRDLVATGSQSRASRSDLVGDAGNRNKEWNW
jgi:hypothetical protein